MRNIARSHSGFRQSSASGCLPALGAVGTRDIGAISEEIRCSDRRALDDVMFGVLMLTRGERDPVYEAVINLVEARLGKADSLRR